MKYRIGDMLYVVSDGLSVHKGALAEVIGYSQDHSLLGVNVLHGYDDLYPGLYYGLDTIEKHFQKTTDPAALKFRMARRKFTFPIEVMNERDKSAYAEFLGQDLMITRRCGPAGHVYAAPIWDTKNEVWIPIPWVLGKSVEWS